MSESAADSRSGAGSRTSTDGPLVGNGADVVGASVGPGVGLGVPSPNVGATVGSVVEGVGVGPGVGLGVPS